MELMAGNPRFLEVLLFRLGRPEGLVDRWEPSTFVTRLAELASPSAVMDTWLSQVTGDVLKRYGHFDDYLTRGISFGTIVPQLVGHTLFQWDIRREHTFEDGTTVQQLEEDGVIFLTPQAVSTASSSAASSARGSSADPAYPSTLRMVLPFLWLHRIIGHYRLNHSSAIARLPLVDTLQCILSPAQNEELTMAVLSLKCFCLVKLGKQHVFASELLGVEVGGDPQLLLPRVDETLWTVCKLDHQVVQAKWRKWHTEQIGASSSSYSSSNSSSSSSNKPPRSHFFLNGEHAPFWDSCALTSPPIFVQDKQRLGSRRRLAAGKPAQPSNWASVEEEREKCLVPDSPRPIFLFCTDDLMRDRPSPLPPSVALIDRSNHLKFFGPILAHRRDMCLSEVTATASAAAAGAPGHTAK
jgi:hypothetical protein